MTVRILQGDCREVLRTLADESVHCCVTSPPYFGLRDYGVDGQIGLEQTPAEFVEQIVGVMREVRRVLRPDGTLWLNLGDSYCTTPRGNREGDTAASTLTNPQRQDALWGKHKYRNQAREPRLGRNADLKHKDLIGIPWRVAFALQADGWWLRQDIIWHKPNPMPESVRDRCTKAHEYLFLLTKSERYYFDQASILEPASPNTHARLSQAVEQQIGSARANGGTRADRPMRAVGRRGSPPGNPPEGDVRGRKTLADGGGLVKNNESFEAACCLRVPERNKRSVWTVGTEAFSEAHFATFPPALIEPCIKAGCPEGGTVLDPFGGAGTTGLVADRLQRNAVLIELNPAYIDIAERRIRGDAPLFAEVSA
jgi:DNA modification methylase